VIEHSISIAVVFLIVLVVFVAACTGVRSRADIVEKEK